MEQIEFPTTLPSKMLMFFPPAKLRERAQFCFIEANVRAR